QGNVISAPWCNPLHSFPSACSISLSPMTAPAVAEPRIRPTMKSAERTRTESDTRRSALMAGAQKGDRVTYEKLLRDCVPFIASLPRRQGAPPDRVDDVVQEVLLTVHRARATYDPRRSFEAWLRIIVERRAIDVLRQVRGTANAKCMHRSPTRATPTKPSIIWFGSSIRTRRSRSAR